MAGSFARVNRSGQLEIKWFDFSVFGDLLDGGVFDVGTPSYVTGDIADGGDFTFTETTNYDGGNFTDLAKFHHIYKLSSSSISTDYITITGIQVIRAKDNENYLYGTTGYVLSINNILINSGTTQSVATTLGNILNGMVFRPLSVSALSDPSIEAGDVAYVSDRKGNSYQTLITTIQYKIGGFETFRCDAETVSEQQSVQYTAEEKAVVTVNEQINTTVNETYITGKLIVSGIDADVIDVSNLVVGDNVTMGANATISWDQVTDQPSIPVLPSYITSTKITSTTIESPSISGGTITGADIYVKDTLYMNDAITDNDLVAITVNQGIITMPDDSRITEIYVGGGGCDTYIGSNGDYVRLVGIVTVNGSSPSIDGHTHSSLYNGAEQVYISSGGNFASSNNRNLGASSQRWSTIYLVNQPDVGSDKRIKDKITDLPQEYVDLLMLLSAKSYVLILDKNGITQLGFIAQDVEDAMKQLGMKESDFGGFVKTPIYSIQFEDGEYDTSSEIIDYMYSLRYESFIPILTKVIQEQNLEITKLKARLTKIEALLGIGEV
ncbi:MAG: tail fiber domain-containing protein [Erysipelotrichaceae bacterium]|nr:tail fiber domain-containing protein [Erysipelotrichaceae bacterium]